MPEMTTKTVQGMPFKFIICASADSQAVAWLSRMQEQGAFVVGPEVYGGQQVLRGVFPGAGQMPFPGTAELPHADNGMQACLVSAEVMRPITYAGKTVGVYAEDEHACYALLGGLHPWQTQSSPYEQTLEIFAQMQEVLQQVGMSFADVIRTWFFNDRILDWYGEFNRARDAFFEEHDVFNSLVPASTGIGSRNVWDAALMARVYAVRPKSAAVQVQAVPSPLQCPALDYRSSFSRAVEVQHPQYRHLIISGTASIEPGGKTAHVGDVERQVELTLDVVQEILRSRGMDWQDTMRAVVYLKESSYLESYESIAAARGISELPAVWVQADVCRDDLLFEIELDAAVAR